MRIYFDVCCLNSPFDDQSQHRIRLEAEALDLIFDHISLSDWLWVGSEVVSFEVKSNPDVVRRQKLLSVLGKMDEVVRLTDAILDRGAELSKAGFGSFDSLHIASAEAGGADVLLSTDDKMVKRAGRIKEMLSVRVENPLVWFMENR